METISVKSEGGKMDCFLKTLRLVESLEKRLGTAATADDRANFRQFLSLIHISEPTRPY